MFSKKLWMSRSHKTRFTTSKIHLFKITKASIGYSWLAIWLQNIGRHHIGKMDNLQNSCNYSICSRLLTPVSVTVDSRFDCKTLDDVTLERRITYRTLAIILPNNNKKSATKMTSDLCERSAAQAEEENDIITTMWKGCWLEIQIKITKANVSYRWLTISLHNIGLHHIRQMDGLNTKLLKVFYPPKIRCNSKDEWFMWKKCSRSGRREWQIDDNVKRMLTRGLILLKRESDWCKTLGLVCQFHMWYENGLHM